MNDHQQAINTFEEARSQIRNQQGGNQTISGLQVRNYLDESIPVLNAHLQMIKNIQQDLGFTSNQNTANAGNNTQASNR